ncbi:MAG: protein phosphatase 2C domain-containing protein [Parcubacteria group bacterium]|nr:protein phosphatase 2C domain-containing protein [Parcubacteria group bacterium]
MKDVSVQVIHSKGVGVINEDVPLVIGNTFAAFDGVTSLVGYKNAHGETGGRIAARLAAETFAKGEGYLRARALHANTAIRHAMEKVGVNLSAEDHKENRWGAVCAAVELHEDTFDVLTIGDSFVLGITADHWGMGELLTPYVNLDIKTLRRCKELADARVRNINQQLRPHILKVRNQANEAYGVLNGDPNVSGFIQTNTRNIRDFQSLLIFTDGFLIPHEDPDAEEEWDLMVRLYKEGGLKAVLSEIRAREQTDPNCWHFPRVKVGDDATAIAIDFLP